MPTCKSQGRRWSGQGSWRRDARTGLALACLPYMSRCAGSIFVQFIWLLFSCIHCVQKATQKEKIFTPWLIPFLLDRVSHAGLSEDGKFQFYTLGDTGESKKDIGS